MRVKLNHHAQEWLAGDLDPPPPLQKRPYLSAWRVHPGGRDGLTALKLQRGTGVWDASGGLLFYVPRGADMAWLDGGDVLLSLEPAFENCRDGPGVRQLLKWLDPRSFVARAEMEVCVPTGGARYLVPNHAGDACLATWLDQTQWGYVMLDLRTRTQMREGLYWPSATLSPPAFSPDDQLVVACHYFRGAWWNDESDDPAQYPSPGGLRKVGTISVHDVAAGVVSQHDVVVRLPRGWIPDRPERGDWEMIWGPEFVAAREFKIWLPDDSVEVLTIPLPPQVVVDRPLGTVRSWLD